jgi:peptidoglycan/LPS O-acetylase OafA/YrhL
VTVNKRFQELDALRGIAALLVVVFHFTMHRPQSELGFKYGITGVDLFFIISGFVIFMSINNVNSAKEFVVNRITRLYPTYWACVTTTYIASVIISHFTNNSHKLCGEPHNASTVF